MSRNEISNKLILGNPSANQQRDNANILRELEQSLISMLKALSTAFISDDPSTDTFLGDYQVYKTILDKLRSFNLVDKMIVGDEDYFNVSPTKRWMECIVIIMVSLYHIPNRSIDIVCDHIGFKNNDGNSTEVAMNFALTLQLEAYDWNSHVIELYIPTTDNALIMFSIDDEIRLFSDTKY